jgi:hypothetical protein
LLVRFETPVDLTQIYGETMHTGEQKIEVTLWPRVSVTGRGILGTGATILTIVIVLIWLAAMGPQFIF